MGECSSSIEGQGSVEALYEKLSTTNQKKNSTSGYWRAVALSVIIDIFVLV